MCIDGFESAPERFVDVATGQRAMPSKAKKESNVARKKVAILLFEGVQIIDYTGPYEVFGQAGYDVFTVAERPDLLSTNMGMEVKPTHSFADAPKADVVVLPGGNVQDENPAILGWVKNTVGETEHVLTVCNGAFYLGRTGLLDGLRATTYYGLIDALQTAAPKAEIVSDQRFTDNGKIVTTAGLSSGIDGALHMVSKISGFGRAQAVALNMEYDWKPDSTYARASFADAPLRRLGRAENFDLPDEIVRNWTLVDQEGDEQSWEKRWQFETDMAAAEVGQRIEAAIAKKWSRAGNSETAGFHRRWSFDARDGSRWTAQSVLEPLDNEDSIYKLRVAVKRTQSTEVGSKF